VPVPEKSKKYEFCSAPLALITTIKQKEINILSIIQQPSSMDNKGEVRLAGT